MVRKTHFQLYDVIIWTGSSVAPPRFLHIFQKIDMYNKVTETRFANVKNGGYIIMSDRNANAHNY